MNDRSTSLRVVFAGTPEFAVPTLEALLGTRHRVLAVYCQPDRPAGRGRKLRQCPVKARALAAGLAVRQPLTLKEPEARHDLARLRADVMVVAAYGLILPAPVLISPRLGCINIHASLLPRWRGAAPIQRAILAGDEHTGVSIMRMDEGLDTGPLFTTAELTIDATETAAELHERLALLGAQTLLPVLDQLAEGSISAQPQPAAGACYASKLSKDEAGLDWAKPARLLERQVRAFNPWPVASARWAGATIRIWRARALTGTVNALPGRVLSESREGIAVACGEGTLLLTELQLPGKRPLPVQAFLNAHSLREHDLA